MISESVKKKSDKLLKDLGIFVNHDEERKIEQQSEEGPYKPFNFEEFKRRTK